MGICAWYVQEGPPCDKENVENAVVVYDRAKKLHTVCIYVCTTSIAHLRGIEGDFMSSMMSWYVVHDLYGLDVFISNAFPNLELGILSRVNIPARPSSAEC